MNGDDCFLKDMSVYMLLCHTVEICHIYIIFDTDLIKVSHLVIDVFILHHKQVIFSVM